VFPLCLELSKVFGAAFGDLPAPFSTQLHCRRVFLPRHSEPAQSCSLRGLKRLLSIHPALPQVRESPEKLLDSDEEPRGMAAQLTNGQSSTISRSRVKCHQINSLGTNLIATRLWLCQNCGRFLLEGMKFGEEVPLQLIEKTDKGSKRD